MEGFADQVASKALSHFDKLPPKCRPQPSEWCVFAAIVASFPSPTSSPILEIVSSATGSKCTPPCLVVESKPHALHDSHAEVLARRGLVHALLEEMRDPKKDPARSLLDREPLDREPRQPLPSDGGEAAPSAPSAPLYKIKDGVTFHLFVSESPCGDASIYEVDDGSTNFTGAKIAAVDAGDGGFKSSSDDPAVFLPHANSLAASLSIVREPAAQALSSYRLKSGRSNLPASHRSTCHSCSDKILRWSSLGLTGSALSSLLTAPARLASVVVLRDPRCSGSGNQRKALDRAVGGRATAAAVALGGGMEGVPSAHVLGRVFPHSRMAKAKEAGGEGGGGKDGGGEDDNEGQQKQKQNKVSPSGQSANYNWTGRGMGKGGGDFVEMTIGATGLPQQQKKNKGRDKKRKEREGELGGGGGGGGEVVSSRLCRANTVTMIKAAIGGGGGGGGEGGEERWEAANAAKTYQGFKSALASREHKDRREKVLGEEKLWVKDTEAYDFELT